MNSKRQSLSGRKSARNRRSFLASTVAFAALVALRPRLVAAEPARKLKLGFLGVGHSHFKEKFKVIRESPDWELVGLCEEDEAVRAKGPAGARWLSAEELFAAAEVVAVESAVPHHARDAKRALLAGKHVHVEKPPADTLEGLRELLRLAAEKRRLLQIGYMWRHNPGIVAAVDAARQGWLGDVYLVRAMINTQAGPEQRAEWARFRGGLMFELGCHLIDPMVRLLGQPLQVTPHLHHHALPADGLADNCIAVLDFPKAQGVISSASLQPNAGTHRGFEVLGTNGTARVQPLEPPGLTLDLAKPAGPYAAGPQEVKLPAYRRYVDEAVELAALIRAGRALPVSAEQELNVQEALLRACDMG
jgi:predicted dehydrogenase